MIHLHKKYHNKILIYSSNNTHWSSQYQLSSRASSEHHPLNSVEVFRPKSRTSPTLRTMLRLAAVTGSRNDLLTCTLNRSISLHQSQVQFRTKCHTRLTFKKASRDVRGFASLHFPNQCECDLRGAAHLTCIRPRDRVTQTKTRFGWPNACLTASLHFGNNYSLKSYA